MTDFRARDMWYSICLKMQNMIVKEPRTVLLWDYVYMSFHILYDKLTVRDNNDNVSANGTLVTNTRTHAAFHKPL